MMDLYAMREHRTLTVWFGVGFAAAMLGVAALVVADFSGAFSRDLRVTALLPEDGAVVAVNSSVHFHGVEVGKVLDKPYVRPDGQIAVELRIDRAQAPRIPDDVEVMVAPLSVFGNQYVNLVPDREGVGDARIQAGAVLPPLESNRTPSLQSTFVALDEVLAGVHPAELNAGLSGLSQALSGRGRSLGQTLVSADEFLGDMLDLWPTFVEGMEEFAPFATTLALSTPEFLSLLENATVTAETLSDNADAFTSLLGNGAEVSDQMAGLLSETMTSYDDAVGGAAALLEALSQGPHVISELLTGIAEWAESWNETTSGGTVQIGAATIRVTNPAALALAIVSGEDVGPRLNDAVRGRLVGPRTYTRADCPRYGSATGDCGGDQ